MGQKIEVTNEAIFHRMRAVNKDHGSAEDFVNTVTCIQ